mmetsp:Transcript_69680/g.161345  ORF Transcript_69680/g.161345 Transcript_69680/m.161345 type:complete len:94 (-) Transcript_69680:68-349(-)
MPVEKSRGGTLPRPSHSQDMSGLSSPSPATGTPTTRGRKQSRVVSMRSGLECEEALQLDALCIVKPREILHVAEAHEACNRGSTESQTAQGPI